MPRPIIIIFIRPLSIGPWKLGVRLDAGDDADVVGLGGVAVEEDGVALGGGAELTTSIEARIGAPTNSSVMP